MLEKRILLVMCTFGILGQIVGWLLFEYLNDQILTGLIGSIAIITALNYAFRKISPMKKTSVEIAISVSQRIYQRGLIWCGLSGISSFVSLSGFFPRPFTHLKATEADKEPEGEQRGRGHPGEKVAAAWRTIP